VEILAITLLNAAAATSFVLTVLTVLLLLTILGIHQFENRRIRRDATFQKSADPLVRAFLAGAASETETVAELRKDPEATLNLLMQLSPDLETATRSRLRPLIVAFPFVQRELAALKSWRWEARMRGAARLGYLGDTSVLQSLLVALQDDVLAVRFAAARSIVALGCSDAVAPILSALNMPGGVSHRRASEVLAGLGPLAADPILSVLKNPAGRESDLAVAARVAEMLQLWQAVPGLLKLLQHANVEVRISSLRALAAIGDAAAILPISQLVHDPAWEVRNAVMQALGRMCALEQIPLLLQGLSDPSWWVRFSSAKALLSTGQPGVDALMDATEHHADKYGRDMSRQILQERGFLVAAPEYHR
jgi:HEAT repeat protein